MKTKLRLTKWPNTKKVLNLVIEKPDSCLAWLYVIENYPDWTITDFSPEYIPTPPLPDPFPSSFDIPVHLRHLNRVKLYDCDKHGVRLP